MWLILYIILFHLSGVNAEQKTPVVLVHGILSDINELVDAKMWFSQNLDREIYSIEIGNGRFDSFSKNMKWQVDALTHSINSFSTLSQEFHIIGFSQGGLLSRAFVENSNNRRVKTLMTFGTPHMGVYYYSDDSVYSVENQKHMSYTNYWKDPYNMPLYLKNCTFLPILNGEIESDLTLYNKVENFVMVWSPVDEVIRPIESGKYEFYNENSDVIVPFTVSETFKRNNIGIKSMFEEGRIKFVQTNCAHREYKSVACLEEHRTDILQYLY
uniref:Uncharacterized protein n=1 Tax=viral metagenome TaxID=1070528 RepID=A0A6C0KQ33_9ZZZZ